MPGNESVELFQLSPFAGIDATTAETAISTAPSPAPKRAVAGSGYVLNRAYGAFVTTKGRSRIADLPLKQTTGMTEFTEDPNTPQYLIAGDNAGPPFNADILSLLPNGSYTFLSLPEALTPGQQTNFEEYGQWAFMSNGVDTPLKVDQSFNVTYWGITASLVTLSAVTISSGNITAVNPFFYVQTYGNDVQESSPSPLIGLGSGVVATANAISVSNLQVSPDPQVTVSNVYRLGGDSGQAGTWIFVGAVSNGTTQFLDNNADGSLTGTSLVQYRDPPQAFNSLSVFANSVWGFGYEGNAVGEPPGTPATSDAWFSNAYEPWGFNSVNGIIPCGRNAGDDTIQTGSSLGGILVVLKRKSTWVITGNSAADFFAEQLFEIGCSAALTAVYALGQLFWMSFDTVYTFAGGAYSDIGALIKSFIFNLTDADRAAANSSFYDKTYLLSFPTLGLTWGYDLRSGEWVQYPWAFSQSTYDPEGPSQISATNSTPLLMLAAELASGNIDIWFAAETDLGLPIQSYYLSPVSDCGAPQYTKQIQYGVVIIKPVPAQSKAIVTITVITDPGTPIQNSEPVEINVAATNLYAYVFALPKDTAGRTVQVRIDALSNTPLEIDRLSLYGVPLQRFDTNS